jgi:hypothetical protein
MQNAIFIGSWILSGAAIVIKFTYSKTKYKKMKKNIYKMIKLANENLDEILLIKSINLLKELDKKNSNLLTGEMKKGLIDSFLCKPVFSKMDKLEKLFGLSFEHVKTESNIKNYIKNQKIIKEHELLEIKDKSGELKVKLEQKKNKQLLIHTNNRQIVDNINLTNIIKDLHKEYEELFLETFKEKIAKNITIEEI